MISGHKSQYWISENYLKSTDEVCRCLVLNKQTIYVRILMDSAAVPVLVVARGQPLLNLFPARQKEHVQH